MTKLELLWIPLRVLPLPVTAAFLAVLHGPAPTRPADWVLGLAAATLTGLGGRFPVAATLIQSVLLVVGGWVDARTALPMMFILTMITLGELWIRRDGWRCWAGAGAVAAAQVVLYAPYFDLLLSTSSLVLSTAPPVLLGVYVRAVLRTALDAERRRDEAVRDARLAERTAIARELHDLVAHHMASIAVQVGAARHTLGGANPKVDEALAQAHITSRAALTDLKQLMTVLRDPTAAGTATVAGSLPAALAAVVDRIRAAGVTVDTDVDDGAVAGLDSMRRLAVLRVVQEGLTNVVKHAGPHARARSPWRSGRTPCGSRSPTTAPPARPPALASASSACGNGSSCSAATSGRVAAPRAGCSRRRSRRVPSRDPHAPRRRPAPRPRGAADAVRDHDRHRGGRRGSRRPRGDPPGRTPHPDVILMDLRMPGVDGITATARILAARPSTRVLVLTTFDDDEHLYPALDAGAHGFLGKDAPPERLLDAIRRTAAGESPFSPGVLRRIVDTAVSARRAVERPRLPDLTDRERDVLALLATGLSNAEIATDLHVAVSTIKTHVAALMAKTGATNRVRLAMLAPRDQP